MKQLLLALLCAASCFAQLAVQGGTPSGSAAPQSPVLLGGYDTLGNGRNWIFSTTGVPALGALNTSSSAVSNSLGARLTTNSNNSFAQLEIRPFQWNGASWDMQYAFPSSVSVNITSATTTQLVAISGTTQIRVGAIVLSDAAAATVQLEYGTGTACATGTTALTGPIPLAANTPLVVTLGSANALRAPAGNALCLVSGSGTTGLAGFVSYAQGSF